MCLAQLVPHSFALPPFIAPPPPAPGPGRARGGGDADGGGGGAAVPTRPPLAARGPVLPRPPPHLPHPRQARQLRARRADASQGTGASYALFFFLFEGLYLFYKKKKLYMKNFYIRGLLYGPLAHLQEGKTLLLSTISFLIQL